MPRRTSLLRIVISIYILHNLNNEKGLLDTSPKVVLLYTTVLHDMISRSIAPQTSKWKIILSSDASIFLREHDAFSDV